MKTEVCAEASVTYLAEHVVCTFGALIDDAVQVSLRADSSGEIVSKGLENVHRYICFRVRRESLNPHNKKME